MTGNCDGRKTLYNEHGSAQHGGDYEALITLIYFLHQALGGAQSLLADKAGLYYNVMIVKRDVKSRM